MQTAAQFTPEQLIVAGRRAEQQHQVGYALQFYRYLAEKYPNTAEAFEARDALFRLHGAENKPQPQGQPPVERSVTGLRQRSLGQLEPPAAPPMPRGVAPELSMSANDRQSQAERPKRSVPNKAAVATAAPGYRVGRFVAATLSTFGWLLILISLIGTGGIVFLLTVKAAPRALQELASANLLVAMAGLVGALSFGLMGVFAGQVARATFDNADLTRWLASVLAQDHEPHD